MEEVIIGQKNGLGIIELNREKKLNSLNLNMIHQMTRILEDWERDSSINRVLIKGKGHKAFCAGGDIVALYEEMAHNKKPKENFFKYEYNLDLKIHRYSKPICSLGHGLVMGGGLGIFRGSKYKVVTPDSVLAMPEIAIGLFPDVGATYFLNRMPGPWGYLMGLTGLQLKGLWAKDLGLADYLVDPKSFEDIEREFGQVDEPKIFFKELEIQPSTKEQEDFEQLHEEVSMMNIESLEHLNEISKNYSGHQALEKAFENYRKGSPTSAAVIDRQLRRGKNLTLEQAFEKEERMAECFMKQHDFKEGIRALLIDKDKKPRWRPSTLEQVSPPLVDSHFS
jgi:enoyl-CoA hydratase/carnithine racemase